MNSSIDPHHENDCPTDWTFRGYHLDAGDFTTAMVHFYRAEITRANVWRTRLDTTTNWAVITIAAVLTFVFGSATNPHFVLLLEFVLVLAFLSIESRRHRYYHLWSYRVRLMEADFFAAMLAPPHRPSADWADRLVQTLLHPTYPIPRWESIGLRFRRNYFFLVSLLLASWVIKLGLHPVETFDLPTLVARAAIGTLPGGWVIGTVAVIYFLLVTLAIMVSLPPAWRQAITRRVEKPLEPFVPRVRQREQLATIVTDHGQEVAALLLAELGRGVTSLKGTGMYSGQPRDVLLCAVTSVQIPQLEKVVRQGDSNALLVVSPTERVWGGGFRDFVAPS